MTAPALEARELRRRFAEREVVAGVSFTIERGAWVSLVGPSGCGKTTILHMLGLLDPPSGGRVFLDGSDAWAWDARRRAQARLATIGMVFQTHNLFDHLSVRENVALPAWKLGGSRGAAFRLADRWLERFGLARQADLRAGRLSQGEAQRVAIARALVNHPAVVLADEPTGSLDSENAAAVVEALGQVCKEGSALLVVTHDPALAALGRVIQLQDGRRAR
jgi:lipoprotein-releasing system ATP-binding protein